MNDLDARFSRAIADLDRFLGPVAPQHTSVFRKRVRRRRLMTGGAGAVFLAACVAGLVVVRGARHDSATPAATGAATSDPEVGRGLLTVEDGQPVVLTTAYARAGIEGSLVQQDRCWWFERRNSRTRAAVIFPAGSTSADDAVMLPDGTRASAGDEFMLQGPLAGWSHVAELPDAMRAGLSACLGREPVGSDLLAIYSAADYKVDLPAPPTTSPSATSRPAPITTPPATSAPIGTTATAVPVESVPAERVRVRDVLTSVEVPAPAVLYQAPRDALGFEDCVECDPVTPWAPTVTDDGLVVVADELHREWLVIGTNGEMSTTPYPDGLRAIAPPIVGPDRRIYVVDGNFDDDDAQLLIFDVAALQNAVGAVPITRRVSVGYNGSRWVSDDSIVQLEIDGDDAYIRRYELPAGA